MMRGWLAVPFFALASPALADTILFQSGEHDGFTRLVATLPSADTKWQLTGSGRTYTIKVEGEDLDFVTDSIFSRIPRTRLTQVQKNEKAGEVTLTLGCDCEISSSWYNDRHVIFDIQDGSETPKAAAIPTSFALQMEETKTKEPLRYTWAQGEPVASTPTPVPTDMPEGLRVDPTQEFDEYVRQKEQVSRVAQQVIDQINRAQDQNLLTPAELQPPADTASKAPTPTPPGKGWNLAQNTVPETKHNEPVHVTTYNAMDVAAQEIAAVLAGRSGVSECIADARLDIESWAGTAPFSTEISRLRSELVGEFDLTQHQSMTALAQFYIAQSFGAEAMQILRGLPSDKQDPVLTAMAELVETGSLSKSNPFIDQGHCPSDVAFWAALSGQQLTGDTSVDSALATLSGLPITLREHLAPFLSNRLVELGHTEASAQVLASIERVNANPGPAFEMAQATLDTELGDSDAAQRRLEKVAAQNSPMAPAALVSLIASHVEQDLALPVETVALVGALAVEHKAGFMGADLRRAHAQARMLSRNYSSAFSVVDEISRIDGLEPAKNARSEVVASLMQHAESFDVITFTISQKLTDPEMLDAETGVDLAQTMYGLGFLDQTKRAIQSIHIDHVTPELHLLKAKIALDEDLPRRAEAELLGVTGVEADTLRAQARSKSGDHLAAANILQEMGETERAAFEAWLGGDISGLSALEIDVYQRVEAMLKSAENTAAADDSQVGLLGRNRSLLSGSEDARDALSELLNMHTVTEPAS
ncbi:MAG: hypothetical protein ACU0A6_02530 [Shimia sp.]|jgi:hypothetical protein|uniref:hypothetical protein n=1 Tax=Shimia sp. TaxID=1954381 RepID=UPI004057FAEE